MCACATARDYTTCMWVNASAQANLLHILISQYDAARSIDLCDLWISHLGPVLGLLADWSVKWAVRYFFKYYLATLVSVTEQHVKTKSATFCKQSAVSKTRGRRLPGASTPTPLQQVFPSLPLIFPLPFPPHLTVSFLGSLGSKSSPGSLGSGAVKLRRPGARAKFRSPVNCWTLSLTLSPQLEARWRGQPRSFFIYWQCAPRSCRRPVAALPQSCWVETNKLTASPRRCHVNANTQRSEPVYNYSIL